MLPTQTYRKRRGKDVVDLLRGVAPLLLATTSIAFSFYVLSIPVPPSPLETYGQINALEAPREAGSDRGAAQP
jgi:hypothetical protein